jgi:hypothetical protein
MVARAGKLTGIYIYDDDERTFCCEMTPSFWLEFIMTVPENHIEDEDERAQLHEDILDAEIRGGDASHYRHCRCVEKLNPTALGEFETMDDAREYAHGNCGSL